MSGDEGVFVDGAPDVTAGQVVADLGGGGEVPLLLAVEGVGSDTTGDVDALGHLRDLLEGSLDTIVDVVEQTGAKLDGERLSSTADRVTDRDTGWNLAMSALCRVCVSSRVPYHHTCLLVDLNGGLIGIDSNDLSYQLVFAYSYLRASSASSWDISSVKQSDRRTNSYMATPIMSSATTTGLLICY